MAENGEKTRIYVGGLGGGVTEDDLRKTFSSLGDVISVDIVRTKDRSFAYLDFIPSSDKSLPKLFSTYNGCMWKGGRLRLEKAKEHYLVRLKREWKEESERATKASDTCKPADASESNNALQKQKKPSPADKTQIKIYFPKLGKVKSLAQVGIGKHKYSFQRIQVPDIPTHFCDCEEHSLAFPPPPNKKQSSELEKASYAVNEQELDIMNSVMNKIFERENPSMQVPRKSESKKGKDESAAAENDEEDHLSDEDNLIINVGKGKSDTMDLMGEMRTMMVNRARESVAKRQTTSTEKPKIEKKTLPLTKKRKSPHSEENDSGNTPIPKTSINFQNHLDTRKDSKIKVESSTKQPENNSLRSLKFSWKGLLGETRKTSFNISNFIATMPQRKEEELKVDDTDHSLKETNLISNKKRKSDSDKEEPVLHINKEPTTEVDALTTETTTLDILANDCQQKEEQPKADNVDILANDCQQKEEVPKADNVEMLLSTVDQQLCITNVAGDLSEKFEEPKADNLEMPSTTISQQFGITEIAGNLGQKEEEPRPDDLDCNFENADSQLGNSNDLKKANDQDLIKTARGDFWRHKSSWTQLISTTSNTSFSISQIVPDVSFVKLEQKTDSFNSQPANKNLDNQDQCSAGKEVTLSPVKKKTSEKRRLLSIGKLESEGTCSFMRTEKSMKEWKKAKTSHSISLNKKNKQANESA